MASLILSPEAAADLEEIVEYIASENVDAAIRVLAEIREAMESGTASLLTGERGDSPSVKLSAHPVVPFQSAEPEQVR